MLRKSLRLYLCALAVLPALLLGVQPALAAPQKVAEFNEKGSFLLIGNTSTWDCATGVPMPVAGTVPASADCGLNIDDSAGDLLWQSDGTAAKTDKTISPLRASSSAVLNIPAGAVVVHARLFWAAQLALGTSAGAQVTLDRPGAFSSLITNDPQFPGLTVDSNGRTYYQGNADVTALVQRHGSGAYRVSGIPTSPLIDIAENVAFVNWHLITVYRKADEPPRNIVVYRGMDAVQPMQVATATLDGFLVPSSGFSGQLGIIGYEGDDTLLGDAFSFNNVIQTNGLNPANNFFNSTRSTLGQASSVAGDLPQMSGQPASMTGLDLDIVDVTAQLSAGATSAKVDATSSGDLYFLGGFVTSITTLFPVFSDSTKTYTNVSRPGEPVASGDIVRYKLQILNNGSDASINTVLRDPLPPQLTYIANSLQITAGPNAGTKTDQPGDDQVEYDAATRTLIIRIGTGATATVGGRVPIGETTTVELLAQVSHAVSGRLDNQGAVSAQGERAVAQAVVRPGSWLTGDGTSPNVPTSLTVDCQSSLQCGPLAPRCERSLSPPRCVCSATADCPSGYVCDPVGRSCVQCTASPPQAQSCQAAGLGSVCLPDNRCGCNSDADCGGRTCNLGTRTCPHPRTDLVVRVIPPAVPAQPGSSALYSVQISNLGPDAATNASVYTQLPKSLTGVSWTCTATVSGSTCPAASGQDSLPPTVTLPAGGQIVYTLTLPVPPGYQSDSLPVTVTVLPAAGATDANPANNAGFGDATVQITDRPDLYLDVVLGLSPAPYTNLYTVNTHNRGPGAAAGAYFVYTVPTDGQIDSITPGDGWTCSVSDDKRTLTCDTRQPIAAQGVATPVSFTVKSPTGATSQPFRASVSPTDPDGLTVTDAKPEDNLVVLDFALSDVMLAGGGLGCSVGQGAAGSLAPLSALVGFLLTTLTLGRRRRRAG